MHRCRKRTPANVARVDPRGGDFEQSRVNGVNRVRCSLLSRESLQHRREPGRVVTGTFQCPYGHEIRLPLVLIVVGQEIGTDPETRCPRQNTRTSVVDHRCERQATYSARHIGFAGRYLSGGMSKHDVTEFVCQKACEFSLGRGGVDHAARNENRSARQRQRRHVAPVQKLERKLKARVGQFVRQRVDETATKFADVTRYCFVLEQKVPASAVPPQLQRPTRRPEEAGTR